MKTPKSRGGKTGYRNPPQSAKFRPGQSGNPRGRPKGARNLATDVNRTLNMPVKVTSKGKPRTVSSQEATLLRLREKALNGDARAMDRYLDFARQFNSGSVDQADNANTADDEAILDAFREEILAGAGVKKGNLETTPEGDTQ